MKKEIINTSNAPAAIGPYVQAINVGDFVFTSGQIALDPKTGNLVSDDVQEQTQQCLDNLLAVLSGAGLSAKDIVKTTVFVKDLEAFSSINQIYEAFFVEHQAPFPARSCVEVARLPRDAKVEIEVIAIRQK